MQEAGWAVVIPVKRLVEAKTRLRGASGPVPHERLVLALAQDTVRAVVACPLVAETVVVTDDPAAASALTGLGARAVPDRPNTGLNQAVSYGASLVAAGLSVATLTADLPALRPAELAAVLRAAAATGSRGFVADAAGTGTTLLAAPGRSGQDQAAALDPRFGPESAARHLASGARPLTGSWPSVRRDVDTAADLAMAAELGLGSATAEVYRKRSAATPSATGPPRSRGPGRGPAPVG